MKFYFSILFIFIITSCSQNSNFEQITESLESGAYLRILDAESTAINPTTPDESIFTLNMEVVTSERGAQITSVDVYLTYISDQQAQMNSRLLVRTIEIDQFDVEAGSLLPRYNYELSLRDVLRVTSAQSYDEFRNGDVIRVEWQANMSDGTTFNTSNSGQGVTGQPFYNSPFLYDIVINCEPENENFAVGLYDLMVEHERISCPFFPGSACDHFEGGLVDVRQGRNTQERVFNVLYFDEEVEFYFTLECNKIIVPTTLIGLDCQEVPLFWGMESGQFSLTDFSDDTSIEFAFTSDINDNCVGKRGIAFFLTRWV